MEKLSSNFLGNRKDLRGVNVAEEWRLVLTENEIDLVVQKCADVVNTFFEGKEIVLACILKGAVFFFSDLAKKIKIPFSCYFIEASSYKDKQTQQDSLEILSKIIPSKFAGKYVILIDELFDNGHTMIHVKEAIHREGLVPSEKIFMMPLFKKRKGVTADTDGPDFYGIEVPNVWLVGYGLDDRQEKRGWTYLYACPKVEGVPKTDDDVIFDNHHSYNEMRKWMQSQLTH